MKQTWKRFLREKLADYSAFKVMELILVGIGIIANWVWTNQPARWLTIGIVIGMGLLRLIQWLKKYLKESMQ